MPKIDPFQVFPNQGVKNIKNQKFIAKFLFYAPWLFIYAPKQCFFKKFDPPKKFPENIFVKKFLYWVFLKKVRNNDLSLDFSWAYWVSYSLVFFVFQFEENKALSWRRFVKCCTLIWNKKIWWRFSHCKNSYFIIIIDFVKDL